MHPLEQCFALSHGLTDAALPHSLYFVSFVVSCLVGYLKRLV